jgi:hypothetical protein
MPYRGLPLLGSLSETPEVLLSQLLLTHRGPNCLVANQHGVFSQGGLDATWHPNRHPRVRGLSLSLGAASPFDLQSMKGGPSIRCSASPSER